LLIRYKTLAAHLVHVLTAALASLGVLLAIVTLTPLVPWWGRALAGPWGDPRGEVLIVLGGSSTNDGLIGGNSYWRSAYAVFAYREGWVRQIIITVGSNTATPTAASMRAFLECQGVPREIIVVETQARNTRENALYTKPLLSNSAGQRVLLTSDFHMFRARRVFEKVGIDVRPRPIPDVLKRASTWRGRWPAFLDLIFESAKIAYYYAHGWI
jgi:uncharacterized SAM-binding protein YcdF (DUF218 family)